MRDTRFTFLCNDEERKLLRTLAQRLSRTESDTVRWLIRQAVGKLLSTNVIAREDERDVVSRNV